MVRPWNEWLIVWGYDINEAPPEVDEADAQQDRAEPARRARPRRGDHRHLAVGQQRACTPPTCRRAACSAPATPSTGTRRATGWAPTPPSRTPTTWPGSSPPCSTGRPRRHCWRPTRPNGRPVAKQIVLRANQSSREFVQLFEALGIDKARRPRPRWPALIEDRKDEHRRGRGQARGAGAGAMELKNYEFNAHGVELGQFYESGAVVSRRQRAARRRPATRSCTTSRPRCPASACRTPGSATTRASFHPRPGALWTRSPSSPGSPARPGRRPPHKVAEKLGVPVETVVIGPGREVTDLYYDWAKLREVEEDGALLVRPDKHIGWRSDRPAGGPGSRAAGRRCRHSRLREHEAVRLNFEHETLAAAGGVRLGQGRGEPGRRGRPARCTRGDGDRLGVRGADRRDGHRRHRRGAAHDDVAMHVPVEEAERARAAAAEHGIDLLVCVGGGSTTGLAKAIALTTGLPIVAVPTTYAGSEATNVWGLTEAARKTTGVDDRVLPVTVVYDADLTAVAAGGPDRGLGAERAGALRRLDVGARAPTRSTRPWPPKASAPSPPACPRSTATRRPRRAGSRRSTAPTSPRSRSPRPGPGLHHKICHVLGGTFEPAPRADPRHRAALCACVQRPGSARRRAPDRRGVRRDDAVRGPEHVCRTSLDAPTALRDYGFPRTTSPKPSSRSCPPSPPATPAGHRREPRAELLRPPPSAPPGPLKGAAMTDATINGISRRAAGRRGPARRARRRVLRRSAATRG